MQKCLLGHKLRFKSWVTEVPPFTAGKVAASMSPELTAFSNAVATCETVVARGTDDMITAANSEVRKLFKKNFDEKE